MPSLNRVCRLNLIHQIEEHAMIRGDFTLSNGNRSSINFDFSRITTHNYGIKILETCLQIYLQDISINSVGGPAQGAVPLVTSLVRSLPKLRGFFVRLADKNKLEGVLKCFDKVILIDDVTVTGKSMLRMAEFIQEEYGCEVVRIVSVLDRLEGARELLTSQGYNFEPIVCMNDLDFNVA